MTERPATVPSEAFWDDDDDEWCLPEKDGDGEFHGQVKWWRPDGTLCCTTDYVHGTPEGVFTRFHENGEVSRKGVFEAGKLHGLNVFHRSAAETTENFPRGLGDAVRRAEMDYVQGSVVAARCYDAAGALCMENGDAFPETRPDGVPEGAHFRKREADGEYRWVLGTVDDRGDGTIARTGPWRWWTPEGVLVEEQTYVAGELDGVARVYDEDTGKLTCEVGWRTGEKHGLDRTFDEGGNFAHEIEYVEGEKRSRVRALDDDERGDGKAVKERCQLIDDDPTGLVEYLDAAGTVIASVDVGLPDDLEATQRVLGATTGLVALADELAADKKTGASVFALVRAVGRGEAPPERLRAAVSALARPLSEEAAFAVTQRCNMVVSNIQRFGGGPDKCTNHLFEGVRLGGLAWRLMRVAAGILDDMGESQTALEVIDAAIAAAPADEAAPFEYTRALVRASMGDKAGAFESATTYAAHDADHAAGLRGYLVALFPEWAFWPAKDSRRAGTERMAELLTRTGPKGVPDVEPFRVAIQKSATRLSRHRARLVEELGEADWLVPDVSHLLPVGEVEVPTSGDFSGVGIQHLCRQEWTRLTWLCHFAGLDELGLPNKITPRDDHVALFLIGEARYLMAIEVDPTDHLGGRLSAGDYADEANYDKLIVLTKELAGASEWFGLKIADVEDAPDASFPITDDQAFLSALRLFHDPSFDLFGEREDDEDDEEDEEDEE